MNPSKLLTKGKTRLFALILCLAAAIPQLYADIIVAGSNTALFGGSWTTQTNTSNKMSQYGSTNYYYLAKPNVTLSGTTEYKVVDNGSWYGSNGNNISFTANGTYCIVFVYNTSNHNVRHIGSFQTIVIAGSDTQALGSSWSGNDTNNQMTTTDGITYTLTKNVTYSGSGSYGFKTVVAGTWYGDAGDANGNNINYNIPEAGEYDLTFTFNAVTGNSSVSIVRANVPTYDYTFYVYLPNGGTPYLYLWNGSNQLNGNWPGTQMTQTERLADNNDWYKVTVTCEYATLSAIVDLGNGANQSADINNLAPDTYYITWDGGNRTTADVSTDAPTAPPVPDYFVVGDLALIGHDWTIANDTKMTETSGIYTWSKNDIHLNAGNYKLKVKASTGTLYGNDQGGDVVVNADANGTYNLQVTFDPATGIVSATLTKTATDPIYTYDIYVRYTGNENPSNVYAYVFDSFDNNPLGNWGGTALTAMTAQTINGYTYYHVTVTSYDPAAKVIFNENQSGSTQTANLDLLVGDNYFTYNGGSSVVGPTSDPDEEPVITYYVVGDDTNIFPNNWDMGDGTSMTDNGDGTYTWTSSTVHLNAGTNYTFKVRGDDNSWHPLNSGNQTFNVDIPGTYTVTVTYDSNNETVTATTSLVQTDPVNTFTVYVRYTGNEDISNVNLHAWDSYGDKTTWPGLAFADMTSTVINSFTYYTITYTSYASTMGILFNENGSVKTADLTLQPGDNYFTYGGGSTVTGPNSEADPRTAMYLIGVANNQQWAANAGIEMEYDEASNLYTLTNVVLTANSQFAFATQLGSSNSDWAGLNAYRLNSKGNSHWAVTEDQLGDELPYKNYVDDNHNWYIEQAGSYDITVNPANRTVTIDRRHDNMYISYGVNWTYADNSLQMTTVDGITYQATITLNYDDFFLFSTERNDETAWGASNAGYDITDIMIGYAQQLVIHSLNNFHFVGTPGKYIVVVNKEKKTVTLRKTADATVTKIFLEQTSNVTLDPAGGTYNGQTLEGKRGGIYVWNKVNLQTMNGQTYTYTPNTGPTNYTYAGEVGNDYGGDNYLKDLPDSTTYDGKKWYAWSVSNSICDFYFIRQGNTDLKSQKILRRAGEVWLTWIDEDATYHRQDDAVQCDSLQEVTRNYFDVSASGVSNSATMLEDHYYVYYTNTTGWDSVYCYAWYEDATTSIEITGEYPGTKCTFAGYDENGYEVWCYDFGLIEEMETVPTGVIFDNGRGGPHEGQAGDAVREQTGDLVFDNGACYDYLGLIYLGNSLNAIINGGVVNGPKYTVEDDLIGVYYDEDAETIIPVIDEHGTHHDITVIGALYAKDFDNYSAKSRNPNGTTDYVYDICAHKTTEAYPGGSQIQLNRTSYDQSNWVKIVLSPNFDNNNAQSNGDVTYHGDFDNKNFATVGENYLAQYVDKIIPGHSMSGNLVNNVNPQMHITNIAKPIATTPYEKNVYVTGHFNDTVVFSYVHNDWCPGTYEGVYRTVPILATDEEGHYIQDATGNYVIDHTEVLTDQLYKMFYVAPKPQEIAYITWAVFDHPIKTLGTPAYTGGEPDEPGAFYTPMNWNRTDNLWSDPNDPNAAWGTTYGPYSNGFMQYGAFQVNWSLFEDMSVELGNSNRSQDPWYRIFKPGQAYKILALIRYAHGETIDDVEYTAGVYQGSGYNEGGGNHVANAPRRANDTWDNMYTTPYDNLDKSKFIVFPLRGSSADSNGSGVGNVTTVNEVKAPRTIVGVHYYNLMGVMSDKPFDGLNIVVTTYSDGSRTSKKILR